MQYFTVQAPTSQQALEKMKREYGDQAMILTQKNFRQGGVFGIFTRPRVEITGYISQSPSRKMAVVQEKQRILENARKEHVFQQLLWNRVRVVGNGNHGRLDALRRSFGHSSRLPAESKKT